MTLFPGNKRPVVDCYRSIRIKKKITQMWVYVFHSIFEGYVKANDLIFQKSIYIMASMLTCRKCFIDFLGTKTRCRE